MVELGFELRSSGASLCALRVYPTLSPLLLGPGPLLRLPGSHIACSTEGRKLPQGLSCSSRWAGEGGQVGGVRTRGQPAPTLMKRSSGSLCPQARSTDSIAVINVTGLCSSWWGTPRVRILDFKPLLRLCIRVCLARNKAAARELAGWINPVNSQM